MSQSGAYFVMSGTDMGILFLSGNVGGMVPPDINSNINVIGAGAITVSGDIATNTLTISTATDVFTWNSVTSVAPPNPIQIVVQNAYICNGGAQVTFILPLAPTIGDRFLILSNTSTFLVTQNGAQQIRFGASVTTAGIGTLASNTVGDCVEIVYVSANFFMVRNSQGTITTT